MAYKTDLNSVARPIVLGAHQARAMRKFVVEALTRIDTEDSEVFKARVDTFLFNALEPFTTWTPTVNAIALAKLVHKDAANYEVETERLELIALVGDVRDALAANDKPLAKTNLEFLRDGIVN